MILLLTQCFPPDPGGIETLMGGLARQLAEDGGRVLVLADHIRGHGLAEPAWPPGCTVRRFGGLKPLRRWRKARAVQQAIASGEVAGIIADSWKSAALLPPSGPPSAVLAHGMEFPPRLTAMKRQRIVAALGRAGVVIANSEFTAGLTRPFLGDQRLAVVHPPIPPQPPASEAARRALAARLGGGAGPLLLTLARLEPRKGIDMVLHALPALMPRYPGLRYAVAGGGGDLSRLQALAASLGVAKQVIFLGRVAEEEKAALYEAADLFVMPARREGASVEGFGIAYLEAAWYRLPALAGREGGGAEAVLDEKTGLLCDGADPSAVTEALDRLLGDAELRQRLGEAAAQRVRVVFGWRAAAARYRALLG